MSKVYLFFGPDSDGLEQTVRRWSDRFKSKYDYIMDYIRLDAKTSGVDKIIESLSAIGVFSEARLIIIDNLLTGLKKTDQDKIMTRLVNLPERTTLLLIENRNALDKSDLFDWIKNNGHVEIFRGIGAGELKKTALKMCKDRSIDIDNQALSLLIARSRGSSSLLSSNLTSMFLYKGDEKISFADVELMIRPQGESRIFQLFNSVINGEAEAIEAMTSELSYGAHPLQIVAILIGQSRRRISDLRNQQVSEQTALEYEKNCRYFHRLCLSDLRLKTGGDDNEIMLSLCRFSIF